MKSTNLVRHKLLWAVLSVVLIFTDHICKLFALSHLKGAESVILLPEILELEYVENYGMAFGLLEGGRLLFVLFALVFLILAAYLIIHMPSGTKYGLIACCLTFMSSGAAGNCLDRMFYGYVVDYIYVSLIRFPVFNLADIFVVCGGITLMIILLFFTEEEELSALFKRK